MKLLVFSEGQHVHCCTGWRKLNTAEKMMKLLVFSEGQHLHCCTGGRTMKYCSENDETISVFRGATCTLLYRLEKAEVLLRK